MDAKSLSLQFLYDFQLFIFAFWKGWFSTKLSQPVIEHMFLTEKTLTFFDGQKPCVLFFNVFFFLMKVVEVCQKKQHSSRDFSDPRRVEVFFSDPEVPMLTFEVPAIRIGHDQIWNQPPRWSNAARKRSSKIGDLLTYCWWFGNPARKPTWDGAKTL